MKNSSFIDNMFAITGYSGDKTPVDNCYFSKNVYCLTAAGKTVNHSVFENNDYGLFNPERISVSNSTFKNHKIALNGGRGIISNCIIKNNRIGIQAFFQGFQVEGSIVIENDSIGIILDHYNGAISKIENSKICYNGKYNVYNDSYVDFDMPNNCFCLDSEEEISESIFDGIENINRGIVSFSGFITDCGIRSPLENEIGMCGGNEIMLSAENEDFKPNYIWKNLDENKIVSDSMQLVTDVPGSYSLEIIGKSTSVIDTFDIINYEIPTSPFQAVSQICFGDTLDLTYIGNAAVDASYSWDFDGATVISGSGQGPYQLSWESEGSKSLALTVSENGCTSETTETLLSVNENIDASFSVNQIVCEGENTTFTFDGTAPEGTIYHWEFDGGTVLSENDTTLIEVEWPTLGQKEISLSLELNGCTSNTHSFLVDYNAIPSSSFSVNSSTVCPEETSIITYSGTGSTEATYNWDFDDATVISGSGQGPYELSWNNEGSKTISLEITENGYFSVSTETITVNSVSPKIGCLLLRY